MLATCVGMRGLSGVLIMTPSPVAVGHSGAFVGCTVGQAERQAWEPLPYAKARRSFFAWHYLSQNAGQRGATPGSRSRVAESRAERLGESTSPTKSPLITLYLSPRDTISWVVIVILLVACSIPSSVSSASLPYPHMTRGKS